MFARYSNHTTNLDEGTSGVGKFLSELGIEAMPSVASGEDSGHQATLYRLSDSTGAVEFTPVDLARSSLVSEDAFLLDDSANIAAPAVYVWIGRGSSMRERRLALQYAQQYLYKHSGAGRAHLAVNLVKMVEGRETVGFSRALDG